MPFHCREREREREKEKEREKEREREKEKEKEKERRYACTFAISQKYKNMYQKMIHCLFFHS